MIRIWKYQDFSSCSEDLSSPCCHTRIEPLSEPAVQFNTVLLQYTKVYDRVWENQPCIAMHMVLFQEIHNYTILKNQLTGRVLLAATHLVIY